MGSVMAKQGLELLFSTFARPVVFVLVFLGFHLFWRGHNAPGGGFIAGLVVAVAALLSHIVLSRPFLTLEPRRLLPWGLLLALLPGVVPMVFGSAFLKSAYGYLTWPLIGEFEWASAVVFDAGVFLVVVGTTLTIIELLAQTDDTFRPVDEIPVGVVPTSQTASGGAGSSVSVSKVSVHAQPAPAQPEEES